MRDLLQKALQPEPEHADSYYVLGQLFEQVPGGISFGDKDWAVSLGRKAVDLRAAQVRAGEEDEIYYDYYTELAKHLLGTQLELRQAPEGAGQEGRPVRRQDHPLEKNCYYEGALSLKDQSDREEARELLGWAIGELQALPRRTQGEEDDLQEALELHPAGRSRAGHAPVLLKPGGSAHPGASIGQLWPCAEKVPEHHPAPGAVRAELQAELRSRYGGRERSQPRLLLSFRSTALTTGARQDLSPGAPAGVGGLEGDPCPARVALAEATSWPS